MITAFPGTHRSNEYHFQPLHRCVLGSVPSEHTVRGSLKTFMANCAKRSELGALRVRFQCQLSQVPMSLLEGKFSRAATSFCCLNKKSLQILGFCFSTILMSYFRNQLHAFTLSETVN